jgi:triosephosphate isomerase
MRKIAAGNWKMNGSAAALGEISTLADAHSESCVEILICPPAVLIAQATAHAGNVQIGGQDCHANTSGAHTGDIAAEMLAEAGATAVIVGHSERRTDHSETDATIKAKSEAAHRAGLTAIVCIGETLAQREAGTTLDIITTQLNGSMPDGATSENTVIAYEPVWAIGTGKVPTLDQIGEVHAHIRAAYPALAILYGGSVKGSNAKDIFSVPHVNGALVGGASLKAADFSPIISALESY